MTATDKPFVHLLARSFGQSTGMHPVLVGTDAVLGGCGKTDLGPALLDLPFYWENGQAPD